MNSVNSPPSCIQLPFAAIVPIDLAVAGLPLIKATQAILPHVTKLDDVCIGRLAIAQPEPIALLDRQPCALPHSYCIVPRASATPDRTDGGQQHCIKRAVRRDFGADRRRYRRRTEASGEDKECNAPGDHQGDTPGSSQITASGTHANLFRMEILNEWRGTNSTAAATGGRQIELDVELAKPFFVDWRGSVHQ
jgi:hypothetical protein